MNEALRKFLRLEASGGIILIVSAIIALIMANSPLQNLYLAFLDTPVAIKISALEIAKPLILWINDGLMAVFFLVVGLEVKRELMEGSLAARDKAIFPAVAAIGGMVAPALIYLLFNGADEVTRGGWAIPAATDIAFAVGVLALLGKRVPTSLKVFLLALAIIDDLGAIVIIAFFYNHGLSVTALALAGVAVALLAYMNWRNVSSTALYMIVGLVLWVCVLKSGVHATLAGVILGFLIPLRTKKNPTLSGHIEHALHPWVAYLVLPIFAFANSGVSLAGVSMEGLTSLLPMGIFFGLLLGKPLGIFSFCWLSVKMKLAKLPEGVNFSQIFAISVLCGIGFTMSIFIASLAFGDSDVYLSTYSRLGILLGSTTAAVVGYFLLKWRLPAPTEE